MKMYLVSRLGGLWTCILPFWMTAIRSVEGGWIRDLLNEPSAILGGKRSPVTKVWEKVIEEGEIELDPNLLKIDLNAPNSDVESGQITFIPAKILIVDKQADKHRVIVRILLRKYRGSFDTLMFGENKPLIGSCHDGRLDLIYHRDPGLKEGQPFPLWTIQ